MSVNQDRLSQLVRQQRQQLGLSIRAAAMKAGVDRATWTGLEDGTRVTQDRHYAGIERALGWLAGTIQSIISGEQPKEPELLDDNERTIWAMDLVDEDLRREYIRLYRQRQQRPPSDAGSDIA